MPADIRAFFGGTPASSGSQNASSKKKDEAAKAKPTKKSRKSTVIEDSDDEIIPTKKPATKKATPKKQPSAPAPKMTETTATDYFATSSKSRKKDSAKAKPEPRISPPPSAATTPKASTAKPAANGKKQTKSYSKAKREDDDFEDLDNDDDVFTADYKKGKSAGDDYDEGSEIEDEPVKPLRVARGRTKKGKVWGGDDTGDEDAYVPPRENDTHMKDADDDEDFVVPDDDVKRTKPKRASNSSKKRKSVELEDEDDEEPAPKKGKGPAKAATPKTKAPAKPKAKKAEVEDSAEIKAILDDIPLVRAPTPPPKDDDKKWNYKDHVANRAAPSAVGSKDMPTGAENCLAGLSFVFTGVLESLDREAGIALVKRYGGKVVGAPSGKTSYVVLGADAGPTKLTKIRENKLKTINEDGLFELIKRLPANGGDGKAAAAAEEKTRKEAENAMRAAQELEEQAKEEKRAQAKEQQRAKAATGELPARAPKAVIPESSKLWTVKYAPTSLQHIVGNKTQVEKLAKWLRAFPKNMKMNFKLGGPDGSGTYRAVIIYGPPGIGKTTAAHLVAKLEGYDIVERNASDTRSKKLMEEGLKGVLSTTSLLGYFAGDGKRVEESKKKLVLIMDEVDGMSAGDRGGVGALAAVCKKTQIPMILICNDRKQPKMKPFDFVTYDLPFRRPTTDQIRSRIMTITFREHLKIPPTVINALIEGTGADIRQVVNMISTAKLDDQALDFDKGKEMSKAWEKHVVLKPWDITSKILGGGMFTDNSKSTLNEKIELYFNDHEFSFLMLQENYLGTQPIRANSYVGQEKRLKQLELADNAAQSISDGDLVDRLIHGSQQQWSLMPTHAVFSFVRPASYVSGSMAGSSTRFTSWLGNNSKQQKLTRMVKEIQGHMRLRSSGDRHEVRQQYVPVLWNMIPKRLEVEGKDAVQPVIDLMDSYFLGRDDFDAIAELGVGPMDMEKRLKIDTQAKSTFTRLYNQQAHPLPFMKASSVMAPKKAKKEVPDLEEAIEDSDDGEPVEDAKDEEEGDLSKDKYIKAPKKKAAPKAKAAAGKGKKRAVDSDAEESEAKKTKASSSKGKGKGKAKAK